MLFARMLQPPAARRSSRPYTEKALSIVKKSRSLVAFRPGEKAVLFVSGVQRSGTTLLMRMLDRSWSTEVFHEHYTAAYEDHALRDTQTLNDLICKSSASLVIFKALKDNFRLLELLDQFDNAKAIWAFRRFDDVVISHVRKWPGGRNRIDDIVVNPSAGEWRSQGMTQETLKTLRFLYKEGMSDASAQALFWYYRNQLLFDQGLQRSNRVLLLNYDALVTSVEGECGRLETFARLPVNARMSGIVSSEGIGKHGRSDILPGIREVCDQMYTSLLTCWEQQRTAPM